MTQQDVVDLMKSSASSQEWNENVSKVKRAFNGDYPEFWYSAIIASGLAGKVAASYGAKAEINVTAVSRRPLEVYGRPMSLPHLSMGEQIVGVYDQGLGKKDALCESLADMQRLYDSYAAGYALSLEWFAVKTKTSSIAI